MINLEKFPIPDEANLIVNHLRAEMESNGYSLSRASAEILLRDAHDKKQPAATSPDNLRAVLNTAHIEGYTCLLDFMIDIEKNADRLDRGYLPTSDARLLLLASNFRKDRSGFGVLKILLPDVIQEEKETQNEVKKTFFGRFLQAADDYQKTYLIGAKAGMGPKPKKYT